MLVVKLPAARVATLAAAGRGGAYDQGHGRVMKEWLAVGPEKRSTRMRLARDALEFASIYTRAPDR